MAPMAGRPTGSKNKPKGDEHAIEKYVVGGEEIWKKGFGKVINKIEEMRREVRGKMEKIKEEIEKLYERLSEERRAREDKKKVRKRWRRRERSQKIGIASVEWIQERKEREARKNRIVIKGVKWRRKKLEQEVEEFINKKLKVKIKVKKTSAISLKEYKTIVVVEIKSWEQKRNMLNKKVLEKRVFIEDDLTRKEREREREKHNRS